MHSNALFNIPEDNPVLNLLYKEIEGFNGYYLVSSLGTVSNRQKDLKTFINNAGYKVLKLTLDGNASHALVHRLVAKAFIPNPDNKREVNHIDGNKLNNDVCNLEWVTSSENKRHAFDTGLKIYNLPTLGIKKGKGSKYFNVSYDKHRDKWIGTIRHNNKTYFQKRFSTEEEAALHVNWIIDELGLSDRPKNII